MIQMFFVPAIYCRQVRKLVWKQPPTCQSTRSFQVR